MIRGNFVLRRGPVIPLVLRGPDGSTLDVNAVVDSGFTAALTLPDAIITALSLAFDSDGELILGDGTPRQFKVHVAEVLWDGAWRTVLASALGDEVLVGMRLLNDHRLQIDVEADGEVLITPLPQLP